MLRNLAKVSEEKFIFIYLVFLHKFKASELKPLGQTILFVLQLSTKSRGGPNCPQIFMANCI